MKIAVTGCYGRMGQRITALAVEDPQLEVVTLLERKEHPDAGKPLQGLPVCSEREALAQNGAEVLIDFTAPDATVANARYCAGKGIAMVIGTTGFNEKHVNALQECAQSIPMVIGSNMSVGVNVLFKLAEVLARSLPEIYRAGITEAHHIHKKDSPSGTAKTLAAVIEQFSDPKRTVPWDEIEAIREGEIIGDHDVVFEGPDDAITIRHHAKNRDIFAKGSLVAAKFLAAKEPRVYTMQEVLNLK
ncbi:MAG: 4-hydroxy-tetrahydrodipicolinate reductase [Candidatus Omnitrophota bacterium]